MLFRCGIAFLFLTCAAVAQVEQATITGTVRDQTGAIVPAVRVTARNVETGVETAGRTNAEGYYRIPYLRIGNYDVIAEADGFKRARVAGINLTVGLIATVDLKLELGAVQNEVTVAATSVQLEEQSSALGSVVSSGQMTELPLLGRNAYSLVALAPGVIPKGGDASGVRPIISGGRSNTSGVLLDGAESRNTTTYDIAYSPPLEAVQEFRLFTNNFSAEYGRSGGGVLTAATRSGTNELHGSLYEFFRNDKLNANSWASNRVGLDRNQIRRNEYGVAVGGPVYLPKVYDGRNRTFFFVNWEAVPQRSPANLRSTVPTEAERAGDFSQTLTNNGTLIRIFDPTTTRSDPARAGRYIRDVFPGNRIPMSRIDPIARKVLSYYPDPNRATPTENFVMSRALRNDTSKLFTRFDQAVGTKHRMFVSFGHQNNDKFTPPVTLAFPGEGTNGENAGQQTGSLMGSVSDTVVFLPELIGQFRSTIVRNTNVTDIRSLGFDITSLGFSDALKSRVQTPMFPLFSITDLTAIGPDRASYMNVAQWNSGAQGHFTWVRGAHSLKWGTEYTFFAFNVVRPQYSAGYFAFGRTFTQGPDPTTASSTAGNGLATFLLGAPTGGQISDDPSLAASQRNYSWYVQDDWKVLPNLTLNLGIRWDYQTPWTDRYNQLAFFDPDYPDPLTGQKGLLRFVGQDGVSRYQSDPDKNNFAPRVGLAWRFAPKTVLRAGYGLFYYPGSGGIGGGTGDLGSGFLAQTPVYLGPPVAAPNTPPLGASLASPFQAGFYSKPSDLVGSGASSQFRHWITPYNQQWNFNLQRMLPGGMLLEAAYMGSRGQRIWINRSMSAVSTQYLTLGPALDELVPNPYYGTITTGALSAAKVRRSQQLQPFNHYTSVSRIRDAIGDSVYHGMTLRLDKQLERGLRFQVAYTVSKMIDDVPERFGGRSSFIDPNNLRLSRSLSEWDRPQHLVMNFIYQLPFGAGRQWLQSGLASHVIGGWQLSGITTFSKGMPVVITAPGNTRLPGVGATAVRSKSGVLDTNQTLDTWFDTTAFQPAPTYSLGNDSRTEPDLRGPGTKTFDLSVSRIHKIRERVNLQFRAE
ncbi:MAG: TonB-dependent receptor, partial [Acidobacteria bacterium]|nr:TonB-dependent receptor [Acidobacteriota bacterium]